MKLSEDKKSIIIDIESLLDVVPNSVVVSYAEDILDMIHIEDADKHCDCEVTSIGDLDNYELKTELNSRGFIVLNANNNFGENSIVRNSNLKRLFEFLSTKTDGELIKIIDGVIPEEK